MSPTLATTCPDPDTQPLPRRVPGVTLDELLAELAIAEKWPKMEDHCYRCGLRPCAVHDDGEVAEEDGTCSRDLTHPLTLDAWLDITASHALMAVDLYGAGADKSLVAALARRIGAFAA